MKVDDCPIFSRVSAHQNHRTLQQQLSLHLIRAIRLAMIYSSAKKNFFHSCKLVQVFYDIVQAFGSLTQSQAYRATSQSWMKQFSWVISSNLAPSNRFSSHIRESYRIPLTLTFMITRRNLKITGTFMDIAKSRVQLFRLSGHVCRKTA